MAWQWLNVAWYERGARGFWLMLAGFLAAFLALGLLPAELIETPRARAALGASPVAFFLAGFLCSAGAFKSPTRAALFGALSSLSATGFALWVAGAKMSELALRADLALSGLAFCAALGMTWGAACRRSGKAQPRGRLAYLTAKGAPEELAWAGARALAHLSPDWALGANPKQESPGSWRVEFPARPGFFLAVERQDMASDEESLAPGFASGSDFQTESEAIDTPFPAPPNTAQPCLVALALEPGHSPGEWLDGHESGLDPMGLRPAFCAALAREMPGCTPQPLG